MLYFFKDYVVEVKQVTKAAVGPNSAGANATSSSQLSIYDFKN